MWQDIKYGLRMLAKSPGFTAVAVLTLALGIGANTAIFSLIEAVMLRSFPVHDPAHLVALKWVAHGSPNTAGYMSLMSCPGEETRQQGCSFSYPMLQRFQSLSGVFSDVTAMGGLARFTLTGNGPARVATGQMVTGTFFETLGVQAAIGRMLQPADDTRGAPAVAVLSYQTWQTLFGGDPAAVGKTIRLDAVPVTIVGVAAQDFPSLIPGDSDTMWLPLSLQPQLEMSGSVLRPGTNLPSMPARISGGFISSRGYSREWTACALSPSSAFFFKTTWPKTLHNSSSPRTLRELS
ncbi:MAG: ABC transporter permease [Candidatus Acidiferrales bacterium]